MKQCVPKRQSHTPKIDTSKLQPVVDVAESLREIAKKCENPRVAGWFQNLADGAEAEKEKRLGQSDN